MAETSKRGVSREQIDKALESLNQADRQKVIHEIKLLTSYVKSQVENDVVYVDRRHY